MLCRLMLGCIWSPVNDSLCVLMSQQFYLYAGHLTGHRVFSLSPGDWSVLASCSLVKGI